MKIFLVLILSKLIFCEGILIGNLTKICSKRHEEGIYDKALIDKAEQELKRQYVGKGMFAAEVVATVTPVERNQVAVYFNIDEGPVAKIEEITFIGNEAFSEGTIRSEMQLKTGGWLSWYSKDNLYSKQKLTADLETIRSYYLDRKSTRLNSSHRL